MAIRGTSGEGSGATDLNRRVRPHAPLITLAVSPTPTQFVARNNDRDDETQKRDRDAR